MLSLCCTLRRPSLFHMMNKDRPLEYGLGPPSRKRYRFEGTAYFTNETNADLLFFSDATTTKGTETGITEEHS